LLYPLYLVIAYVVAMDWIWNELAGRGGTARRLATTVRFTLELPFVWTLWLATWTLRRIRHGAPPRRPTLPPVDQRFFQTGGRCAA